MDKLLRGGQGKRAHDVEEITSATTWIFIALVALLAVATFVAYVCNNGPFKPAPSPPSGSPASFLRRGGVFTSVASAFQLQHEVSGVESGRQGTPRCGFESRPDAFPTAHTPISWRRPGSPGAYVAAAMLSRRHFETGTGSTALEVGGLRREAREVPFAFVSCPSTRRESGTVRLADTWRGQFPGEVV